MQKIQALQGKRLQAGLGPNPVFSYTGAEMGNDGKAGFQGGTVSQEIVTADKLRKDQHVVDQEILACVVTGIIEMILKAAKHVG